MKRLLAWLLERVVPSRAREEELLSRLRDRYY